MKAREILACNPDEPQWWITGFNPQYEGDIDVNKQVMIGSVDFSEKLDMYMALVEAKDSGEYDEKIQYMTFDEKNHMLWLTWYKEDIF